MKYKCYSKYKKNELACGLAGSPLKWSTLPPAFKQYSTGTLKENRLLYQALSYIEVLLYQGSNVVDFAVRLVNSTVPNLCDVQVMS